MARTTFSFTLPLLLLLGCLFPAYGQTQLTFGLYPFPPDITQNQHGECEGPAVAQLKKLFLFSEQPLKILCVTPARLYKLFANGKVDMLLNIASTKALQGQSVIVKPQFHYINLAFATNKAMAEQKTVSAIRGYNYEGQREVLEQRGYEFVELKNGVDALELFALGRVAHHIGYIQHKEMLNFHDTKHLKLDQIEFNSLELIPTYIHISKKSPHLETINAYLTQLISQKHCQNLYNC
ncbi:hypothetical protein PULV_a3735 [Pseudoalteromonas ulvae UL12]|uniref:hypothetical protein n=1 Tax=Pseudoalteromonas ulvae TaxID=107327 RepID=UPI000A3641E8|nr:hypothetical protein [Pseudoalteromonas ulvae]MBE0362051.1 hypothetical protein [Pseudoalteromonas ulvae UL12]